MGRMLELGLLQHPKVQGTTATRLYLLFEIQRQSMSGAYIDIDIDMCLNPCLWEHFFLLH